ncbi:chitinase-like protein PB1E7.04c isoform X2 [Anopheles albimanus]|uniref:chitinase-like protein PB1E7.04c isoform X2 n=1 Tax=Anopheles albimanus TaxID=7167 RepID=UPI001641B018|nr:chitinase-like protein PB1E7.04c isoform X2 [Anopheles albimanus]
MECNCSLVYATLFAPSFHPYRCKKIQLLHYAEYPFKDHNPPDIELINKFCEDVDEFLRRDSRNVVAIHCKAGKGRTGTMICCYLLYSKTFQTANEALTFYAEKRTKDKKGVTIPSQRRYVEYYEQLLRGTGPYQDVTLYISEIRISPADVPLKSGTISMKGSKESYPLTEFHRSEEYVTVQLNYCAPLTGDVKIEFARSKLQDKRCHFWFNTFFVERAGKYDSQNRLVLSLTKKEIDDAHKGNTKRCPEQVVVFLQRVPINERRNGEKQHQAMRELSPQQQAMVDGDYSIFASVSISNHHHNNSKPLPRPQLAPNVVQPFHDLQMQQHHRPSGGGGGGNNRASLGNSQQNSGCIYGNIANPDGGVGAGQHSVKPMVMSPGKLQSPVAVYAHQQQHDPATASSPTNPMKLGYKAQSPSSATVPAVKKVSQKSAHQQQNNHSGGSSEENSGTNSVEEEDDEEDDEGDEDGEEEEGWESGECQTVVSELCKSRLATAAATFPSMTSSASTTVITSINTATTTSTTTTGTATTTPVSSCTSKIDQVPSDNSDQNRSSGGSSSSHSYSRSKSSDSWNPSLQPETLSAIEATKASMAVDEATTATNNKPPCHLLPASASRYFSDENYLLTGSSGSSSSNAISKGVKGSNDTTNTNAKYLQSSSCTRHSRMPANAPVAFLFPVQMARGQPPSEADVGGHPHGSSFLTDHHELVMYQPGLHTMLSPVPTNNDLVDDHELHESLILLAPPPTPAAGWHGHDVASAIDRGVEQGGNGTGGSDTVGASSGGASKFKPASPFRRFGIAMKRKTRRGSMKKAKHGAASGSSGGNSTPLYGSCGSNLSAISAGKGKKASGDTSSVVTAIVAGDTTSNSSIGGRMKFRWLRNMRNDPNLKETLAKSVKVRAPSVPPPPVTDEQTKVPAAVTTTVVASSPGVQIPRSPTTLIPTAKIALPADDECDADGTQISVRTGDSSTNLPTDYYSFLCDNQLSYESPSKSPCHLMRFGGGLMGRRPSTIEEVLLTGAGGDAGCSVAAVSAISGTRPNAEECSVVVKPKPTNVKIGFNVSPASPSPTFESSFEIIDKCDVVPLDSMSDDVTARSVAAGGGGDAHSSKHSSISPTDSPILARSNRCAPFSFREIRQELRAAIKLAPKRTQVALSSSSSATGSAVVRSIERTLSAPVAVQTLATATTTSNQTSTTATTNVTSVILHRSHSARQLHREPSGQSAGDHLE